MGACQVRDYGGGVPHRIPYPLPSLLSFVPKWLMIRCACLLIESTEKGKKMLAYIWGGTGLQF